MKLERSTGRKVTDVIPATGTLLTGILRVRHDNARSGLSSQAEARLHAALKKTTWGSRRQQTYALMRGGGVLASAERYDMQGALNGRPVPVTGIGAVCCERSPQGDAAALTLIESLARDAENSLVLLFPSAAVDARAIDGFEAIPRVETIVRVMEDRRNGAPMTTVRGGERRDLQAIVAMGRTRAAGFRFHLERDADFIDYVLAKLRLRCGLGPASARELQFFIAEEGVTAAAYVVISVAADEWVLEECGDRDPSGSRVGALLQALIAREPSRERPTIRTSLPPGFLPPQITAVSTQPAASVIRMAVRNRSTASFAADDVLYWPADVF